MLTPGIFYGSGPELDRLVIRTYPLATIISSSPDTPYVTEAPVIVAPDGPLAGPLTGCVLWGHLNRANEHARWMADGQCVKLMFTGPRAYVSPALYPDGPAAPTFDFVSIHVSGELAVVDDAEGVFGIVAATAVALERELGRGWDAATSHEYFRRIMPAVRGFRVHVRQVESMYKLSQDKSPAIRRVLQEAFLNQPGEVGDVGAFMERHFPTPERSARENAPLD